MINKIKWFIKNFINQQKDAVRLDQITNEKDLIDFISTANLSEKILSRLIRYNDLIKSEVLKSQKLSEKFLVNNKDLFSEDDWKLISKYQRLSMNFIDKFFDYLYLSDLCQYQRIPEDFFIDKLQENPKIINVLIANKVLSKSFIDTFYK